MDTSNSRDLATLFITSQSICLCPKGPSPIRPDPSLQKYVGHSVTNLLVENRSMCAESQHNHNLCLKSCLFYTTYLLLVADF